MSVFQELFNMDKHVTCPVTGLIIRPNRPDIHPVSHHPNPNRDVNSIHPIEKRQTYTKHHSNLIPSKNIICDRVIFNSTAFASAMLD
jgi:hypothetical protein